jgi:predicted nucleic acid-binding protein
MTRENPSQLLIDRNSRRCLPTAIEHEAFEIAIMYRRSYYDAIYVAIEIMFAC